MYLNQLVDIPNVKGKITRMPKGNAVYINYEYDREYNRERKYAIPKRVIIGKQSREDPTKMQPNRNYLTYILEVRLSEQKYVSGRSSCLKIGAYLLINKMLDECGLSALLGKHFDKKEVDIIKDLVAYSLICENDTARHFPDYAFDHPLFAEAIQPCSDALVSEFLSRITGDECRGFLNDWNQENEHREKIYISFDQANKSCQAEGIEIIDTEKPMLKADPVFRYAMGYGAKNSKPLFYEAYHGRVVTAAQLAYILDRVKDYGYEEIGFILDRGHFSREVIGWMEDSGCEFMMLVKSLSPLVDELVLENRGSFENNRDYRLRDEQLHGKTIKRKLYAKDEKERYFHIYHNREKGLTGSGRLKARLKYWESLLQEQYGTPCVLDDTLRRYFEPVYRRDGTLKTVQEKRDVIRRELQLCGYFVLITSEKMTAAKALDLFSGRDTSEKLFRGDKACFGNKSMGGYDDEFVSARLFAEFAALIVRSRIYTGLRDAASEMNGKPGDLTVPAALKELEKIEIVRGLDRIYRMDHTVTKTQESILKAYGMDEEYVKTESKRISEQLRTGLPTILDRS